MSDIDRKIAEKVFGLSHEESQNILYKNLPEYSTNISDAWLVVEKIKKLSEEVQIDFEGWFVYRQLDSILDLCPENICKAALEAVKQ